LPDETLLTRTLVELADILVDNFEVLDLLTLLTDRCVAVLDVDHASLMLALPPTGALHVMAASSESMRRLALLELQHEEGPGWDCYQSGALVLNRHLGADRTAWPRFSCAALAAGVHVVHVVPMRLRDKIIGALNLFRCNVGELAPADIVAAQALADITAIAILQHHALCEAWLLGAQLQTALDSRVVLEQAKGMIAQHRGIDMACAFTVLRRYSRDHGAPLGNVAMALVDALEMARRSRGARRLVGPITHSDAVSEFTSVRFTERLDGLSTLSWVHRFNQERLHSHCGDIPPAEVEATFYAAQQADQQMVGIQ
jgi:hypothetical protein